VIKGHDSKNIRASTVKWGLHEEEPVIDPEEFMKDVKIEGDNPRDVFNQEYDETMLGDGVQ